MVNLTKASRELFRREADERFDTFDALLSFCRKQHEQSSELWQPVDSVETECDDSGALALHVDGASFGLNDWSFSQLCRLHGADKQTVNRVSAETARLVLRDTKPRLRKPLQIYASSAAVRSIHGANYSRLYDEELLEAVRDAAPGFEPPPRGSNGATGLYAGEQDLFCFLVDPRGWVEIDGEEFAPGFFVWNSEVGRRSVGVQTFWYQRICANHIVWDAIEVIELKRNHTGNVQHVLDDIRLALTSLANIRDERRDAFANGIKRAMEVTLGGNAEEATQALRQQGIGPRLAEQAIKLVPPWKTYSVFAVVDALTRIAGAHENASDRLVMDQKAAALLSLAA